MEVLVISALILTFLQTVNGYCWQPGKNPYFVSTPRVKQTGIDSVTVRWESLVANLECVDQFRVKYWTKINHDDYIMTPLVGSNVDGVEITGLLPRVEYVFQVIAREDKGVLGVDYNKSKAVNLRLSLKTDPTTPSPIPSFEVGDERIVFPSEDQESRIFKLEDSDVEIESFDVKGRASRRGPDGGENADPLTVIIVSAVVSLVVAVLLFGTILKIYYTLRRRRSNRSFNENVEMKNDRKVGKAVDSDFESS